MLKKSERWEFNRSSDNDICYGILEYRLYTHWIDLV